MKIEPLTLNGKFIRLEPLKFEHLKQLCLVGLEEEIWRWSPEQITTLEAMMKYVETALGEQSRGISLPFVTIEKA